jgi:hypothetical protein
METVVVDSTVQHKALAHPTESRLLVVARDKLNHLIKESVGIVQELITQNKHRKAQGTPKLYS